MRNAGRKQRAVKWYKPLSMEELKWLLDRGYFPIICQRPVVSK